DTAVRTAPTPRCPKWLEPNEDGSGFECEPALGELLERERAFDRGLDVELLDDVGVLSDHLPRWAPQLLLGGLRRLPQKDRAPAVGRLVRHPCLETQPPGPRRTAQRTRLAGSAAAPRSSSSSRRGSRERSGGALAASRRIARDTAACRAAA